MGTKILNSENQFSSENEPHQTSHSIKNVALPVFAGVLKQYLGRLEIIDARITKKLRQSVLAQISLCLSSLEERQRLNAWIKGDIEQLQVEMGLLDMQHCIQHAYLSACGYFGPNQADELLTQAMEETENLPIAREFAPHYLR